MKKSCLIIGTLLWGMSAFAQTTIWKRSGWECRISDKGTLEQIVFKGSQRNDTVPFFHDKSNMERTACYGGYIGKQGKCSFSTRKGRIEIGD